MDGFALQTVRYKLQKRAHLVFDSEPTDFPFAVERFINYLESNSIFSPILNELITDTKDVEKDFITADVDHIPSFDNELSHVGYAYRFLKFIKENSGNFESLTIIAVMEVTKRPDSLSEYIKNTYVKPLYYYIDGVFDDRSLILYLINKYKHICEWFRKEELIEVYDSDTRRGEINLRRSLLEFLYISGIELYLEPESPSGVVDFINEQTSEDPLIADTKVYSGKKTVIKDAFNQIIRYAMDFNKPVGYLVVYNVSDNVLEYALSGTEGGVPFLSYNDKTIFIITVDVSVREETASKERLKTVKITENYVKPPEVLEE